MTSTPSGPQTAPPAEALRGFSPKTAAILVVGVLIMHIGTNIISPYGFHRDEFLYLAMGEHLRLWHMDFPPFIAIVARLSHALFGELLPGIRLAPAFAHAGMVGVTVYATALFGGKRSAQMLAGLGVALSPYFLRPGGMLQPVIFDQLWWTLALLALTLRLHDDDPKHWAGTGLFLGLAALTKFSVAFIAAGFLAALLVTSLRRDLLTKFPWIALIIATVVGHPSVTGQLFLGWPVRGQFADLQANQLSRVSPLSFLTGQLPAGPVLLLAIGGFAWLLMSSARGELSLTSDPKLRDTTDKTVASELSLTSDPNSRDATHKTVASKLSLTSDPKQKSETSELNLTSDPCARPVDYRPIAVVTGTAFLILLVMRGKAYYIAPIYPILIAAGAAALDRLSLRISPARPTRVLAVAAAAVAIYGMVTLPFGLPLLAPPEMSQVSEMLDRKDMSNTGEPLTLPQDYADMLGWPELANITAVVWRGLPPADTANAILLGTNYGRAGALDFFGRDLGLPPVVSPAGSYWFFGPGTKTGDVAVVPTNNPETIRKFYNECTPQARTNNSWGVPEERSVVVYVCRGARASIQDVWPSLAGQN